jgi:peptidoglycan hydrolase-like protein with peptidoglycan-binding domain
MPKKTPKKNEPSIYYLQGVLASKGLYIGKVDGIYGPKTKDAIIKLQKILRGYKVYSGRNTGVYDEETREAVRKWQSIHPPLIVDGLIGPRTMDTLIPSPISDRQNLEQKYELYRSKETGRAYPHESQIRHYYGNIGRNQTKITLPYPVYLAWDKTVELNKILCHKKVAEDLQGIYEDSLKFYGMDGIHELELDIWGGTLNVRKIRGGSRYSTHAWGIAEDRNPSKNQLHWHRPKAQFSHKDYRPFWDIVARHGAYSLGVHKDYDWMHFQFAHR